MILNAIKSHSRDTIALQDEQLTVRYGELADQVDTRRQILNDTVGSTGSVALALDNGVEWVLWDLAALAAGVICVPLPPFFTRAQSAHAIRAAAVTHIITAGGLCSVDQSPIERKGQEPGGEAAAHENGICTSCSDCNRGNQKCRSAAVAADGQSAAFQSPAQDGPGHGTLIPVQTAKITFTSGTTGTAKGVCLAASAMGDVASSIVTVLGEKFVGTHLSVMPLAVLLENVAGVYAGLLAGCTVQLVSLARFGSSFENLHAHVQQAQANSLILAPQILRALMAQTAALGPLPSLRFVAVGGSKLDPQLIVQARSLGLPVYEGYGLSECASVVSLNTPGEDRIGSVGKPLPHIRPYLDQGSIHIEDPGFLGYIGQPSGGDFDTGDLGALDDDGFLSLTGRRKNVLITSYGRNVSPEWVEAALLAQPQIAHALVYGDGQATLSALVVPSPASGPGPAAVSPAAIGKAIEQANATLPDYARIHDFKTIPSLTMADGLLTGTGRPRRDDIFKRYLTNTEQGDTHDIL